MYAKKSCGQAQKRLAAACLEVRIIFSILRFEKPIVNVYFRGRMI